jgi:aminoglycoside 6'-N-acetyltransferase
MPTDPGFIDLRTDRLVIRRFRPEDADAFAAYRADPEVARYQSWDSYTRAMAETFVAETAALHPGMPGEWFQFGVADPSTDALLGDVALRVDPTTPRARSSGSRCRRPNRGRDTRPKRSRA